MVYKTAESGGKVAVALLPYGTSFDCAQVVEAYEETTVPTSVLASETWYGSKQYKTGQTLLKIPVFKKAVLNVAKQQDMKRALEFQASTEALRMLS